MLLSSDSLCVLTFGANILNIPYLNDHAISEKEREREREREKMVIHRFATAFNLCKSIGRAVGKDWENGETHRCREERPAS